MPTVKKKTARGRPRKTKRKSRRDGPVTAVAGFVSRYMTAGAAGVTVIAVVAAFALWTGGYVGLVGERVSRLAGSGAVAAGFEVRRVTGKGFEQTMEHDLLSAIGPVVGSSILHFDPYAARGRIEELGWVRSAAVSRLWPDTIHISVREREPAAVWQISGVLHLIDQNGAIIRQIDAFEYSNLPLIVGAGAPESASGVLQALRAEPALWGATAALIRVGDRRWNVRLKSGGDVKFPETGYGAAVRDLARLHDAYGLLDREIEYVDLRDPNRLVYREVGASEENLFADKTGQ